jgi:uncharacterized sporulation protein YeaH/YhbH (DUF444 family)
MNKDNDQLEKLIIKKEQGLSPEREERLKAELCADGGNEVSTPPREVAEPHPFSGFGEMASLQDTSSKGVSYTAGIRSLDELLERDRQREKDGFPRKIRIGRMIRPGRKEKECFVIVPSTVEEKFIHDRVKQPSEEETTGGSGGGDEGEVIGERPLRPEDEEGEGGGGGAGSGGGESREMESTAYDLGKILTEKFELPNLKDKGKKSALVRYSFDLTDRHRGFGQLLDKKATLRRVLETNFALGNIPDQSDIDTSRLIIAPSDKIYRILSRELDYESQAMVFFLRDYSGSMDGKPSELVTSQHVLIYSWLLYQYAKQVETRFILHDAEAKEVPDFYTYFNSKEAGGTKVAAAYKLVNEIVERENLVKNYNIYIFHGTDGDDWDTYGNSAVPELKQMLTYANRVGITIIEHSYSSGGRTEVDIYLKSSGLLQEKPDLLRVDVMGEDAQEGRLIEGIKNLIS